MSKIHNKFLCSLMIIIFSFVIIAVPAAAEGNIRVEINGAQLVFDVQPRLMDDMPIVPMRAVFEALGAEVEWNGDTRTVTAAKDEITVLMQIDDPVITVNGTSVTLDVPPQLVDGRTLVPVSAIAECFEADIKWDEETLTVSISTKAEEITVSTADEFVDAIGSNRIINVKEGEYDLTPYNDTYPDGFSIESIINLTIIGAENGTTEFVNSDRFCEILNFYNCQNINIINIKAGHTPQEYMCDAGVLEFENCENILIENCYIYGCGSEGITVWECAGFTVKDTTITDCSLRAAYLWRSGNITFDNVKMIENRGLDVVNMYECENVKFIGCTVENNKTIGWSVFEVALSTGVSIENSVINNNSMSDNLSDVMENVCIFLCDESHLVVENTKITNNKFAYEKIGSVEYINCVIEENTFDSSFTASLR